ncbi:hypothetical protein [Leptospira interrogans]|uniref:hypothetical protein n=1 Tax=Leptospira interrogans TaxID=173 RepID=UPI0009E2F9B9|nr:hypothetical protein [Leptospira interrogans]
MIVRKVLVFLFSILIYTLAIHKIGDIIRPGLDESYVLAINKYFANLEYPYSKIFFSYGPLGFLIVPLPVGLNIILSTIFWNILIFFFIVSSLSIILVKTNKFSFFPTLISILLCIWIVNATEIKFIPFLLLSNLLILDRFFFKEKDYFLILSAILISIIGYYMGTYFIALLGYFIPLFILYLIEKRWRRMCILILFSILALLFFRFIIYRDFDIFSNLISILEFSIGNSYSMTLGADSFSWGLFFCSLLPFFLIFLTGKSEIVYYILISFIPIYLTFKYAFTRIDHAPHFFNFITVLFLNMVIISLCSTYSSKQKGFIQKANIY